MSLGIRGADGAPMAMTEHPRYEIAFLTSTDPGDRLSWSGIHYYMARALQQHCGNVTPIGPIPHPPLPSIRLANKLLALFTDKRYMRSRTLRMSKKLGRAADKRLAGGLFDLIFAPSSCVEIAHLRSGLPVVYSSDSTFDQLHGYYEAFSNLVPSSERQANQIEQLAIDRAELILYPSHWAASSALRRYNADPRKVRVIPFGANIDWSPTTDDATNNAPSGSCNLLFVGVDWRRKGGDIAYETLLRLVDKGVPARLTVVGCVPPENVRHENLRVVPSINKNSPRDHELLSSLYAGAHFLLLPTRADCFGIVFCEANAWGVPVIAADTGGVSGAVRSGENGFLLPLSARGWEYCDLILRLLADRRRYLDFRRQARAAFEERLNWNAWARSVRESLDALPALRKPENSPPATCALPFRLAPRV